jgi:hypothetical protein
MNNIIRVDGKAYAKSLQFGNWRAKTVHKNRKHYDRKRQKNVDLN